MTNADKLNLIQIDDADSNGNPIKRSLRFASAPALNRWAATEGTQEANELALMVLDDRAARRQAAGKKWYAGCLSIRNDIAARIGRPALSVPCYADKLNITAADILANIKRAGSLTPEEIAQLIQELSSKVA